MFSNHFAENYLLYAWPAIDIELHLHWLNTIALYTNLDEIISPFNEFFTTDGAQASNMFCVFNQPLNNWNVSKASNMSYMFAATFFSQPITSWFQNNTGYQIQDVTYMFLNCPIYNQNMVPWGNFFKFAGTKTDDIYLNKYNFVLNVNNKYYQNSVYDSTLNIVRENEALKADGNPNTIP